MEWLRLGGVWFWWWFGMVFEFELRGKTCCMVFERVVGVIG